MQKISNRLYLLFVLMSFIFGIFGLTSCSDGNKTSLKLSFEQNEYQLEVGEQIEVEPIFKNAGEEPLYLVWKSYNTSVVSVNDGVLEGVGVGKTEVKVFISGNTNVYVTLTVKVTAKNQIPVAKFNEVPATLYVGDELQLTYELANAENECEFVYQSLTDAATVDQTGLIKVLEEGYALVTVKVTDKVTGQYVNYNFSFEVLTNYDITYVVDEDVNNEENPSFYIVNQKDVVLKEPTKVGYTFKGWYEDEKFTKPISVIDVDRKENITLYADWDAIIYSIEYNENQGKMPTYNVPSEYQYGTTTELPRPRLAGYKFAGWYENENFDGEALFEINDKVTGNKVLYAKYVESILEVSSELDTSKVYKLGLYQGNINKTLFMVGTLSGYYGVATEKLVEAADVKVIKVEDGYNLKAILADGTVKYIDMVASGTYYNIKFNDAPTTVWEYNSEYNTFTTKCGSETVYMGAYSTFDTFSGSKISYAATSFVSHLYEEIEYTDEMKANEILDSIDDEQVLTSDLSLVDINKNVLWSFPEGVTYENATIEDGVLKVTRLEKDDVEIELIATCQVNDTIVTKTVKFIIAALQKEVNAVAIFSFGENGAASHVDGNELSTSASYKDGDYTLSLTDISKVYGGSYDATGKSCLKLGTSKLNGKFNFVVPGDIVKVSIYVAMYKASATEVSVNGVNYTITTESSAGNYTIIQIDTSSTKTISFETVGSKYRCMIDKIVYYGYSDNAEKTNQLVAEEVLFGVSLDKVILTEDYKLPVYENITWKLNETYAAAKLEDGVLKVTRPENEDGDAPIKLIAVYVVDNIEYTKEFEIIVSAKEPEPGANNPVLKTDSLDIKANKGTLASNIITWTSTNFVFRNEKYNSSNAIRTSDTDHFRCYANSKTVIEGKNGAMISQIVITTTSNSYATALNNSVDSTKYTVSVSGSIVTIVPKTGNVDKIEIVASAQWRLNTIAVSYYI